MKSASLFSAAKYPAPQHALWNGKHYSHQRLRIGYFSADFHNHATAYLIAELFESHDRNQFEIFAFSFGPTTQDKMQTRLEKSFDHFFDLSKQGDHEIAAKARELEIDIAIDLKGYTQDSRPEIFALRPAPLQVNYLGFPGTMAAPYIDYIIGDRVVTPTAHFNMYSEKVAQLAHSYQVNDSQRQIAEQIPSRHQLGLPETGFVFCCFNNNFKITPDVFSLWMRLLSKVDSSVLWLFEGSHSVCHNLRLQAQKHAIDPERLIFAPRMELPEHLARHKQTDLFLDTFYYNAHTTASDALWAGLPVLTCLGNTFASRVAASLLKAIGLPELITHNHDEYEALALDLANHPEKISAIKHKLADNRLTQPLFNTALFRQQIESAYRQMWQRSTFSSPTKNSEARKACLLSRWRKENGRADDAWNSINIEAHLKKSGVNSLNLTALTCLASYRKLAKLFIQTKGLAATLTNPAIHPGLPNVHNTAPIQAQQLHCAHSAQPP